MLAEEMREELETSTRRSLRDYRKDLERMAIQLEVMRAAAVAPKKELKA